MRIAVISDVHGNLEALEVVLATLGELGADAVWSLGDIVGYGPAPRECLALVRDRAAVSLLGNHDAAAIGRTEIEDFNEFARSAVAWSSEQLAPADFAYLESLPLVVRAADALLVHASPREPEAWHYIHGASDAAEHFADFTERVCFVGHSHRAGILSIDEVGHVPRAADRAVFGPGERYIVNAGSVGQPRDRDPRSSFALWETATGEVAVHRVAYAVERTQAQMRAAGLPGFLVERLAAGV